MLQRHLMAAALILCWGQLACDNGTLSKTSQYGDGERNGNESDIDCGETCGPCNDGSRVCAPAPTPTCIDGTRSGSETDVDCGGSCSTCGVGKQCSLPGDCESGRCDLGICTSAPSCTDGTHNGTEAGLDCGGNCSPCAYAIPLLEAGTHLSMVTMFQDHDEDIRIELRDLWQQAVRSGMRVARIQLDWSSLEAGAGEFLPAELEEQLADLWDQGLLPVVSIYAVDTEGLVVPADIESQIAAGTRLDDPVITARYQALLAWAVPMVVAHGGWGVLVANEPFFWVEDADRDAQELIGFYRAARDAVHAIDSRLAVGATHTMHAVREAPEFVRQANRVLDLASFNYYPIDGELRLTDVSEAAVRSDLQDLLDTAEDKPVVLQELGCPAGWSDRETFMDATVATQTAFFRNAFKVLHEQPQLRAAFVFELADWSEDFVRAFFEPLEAELPPGDFFERIVEWYSTTGLIDIQGRPRPAWSALLDALGQ